MESSVKPKLICVDDDATIRHAIARILAQDFDVRLASSAEEALALLDEEVSVVIADQTLNGMNGLDFLEVVQKRAPEAVRALISGRIDVESIASAINTSRLHRLILKPWNNEYFRLQMLEALASHSTLREKHVLEQLAVTDPVTQLKNHRYFQDRLRIEVERSARHARELSLIMADIDHFKKFNDKYGHPAGDLVLRLASQRIQDQVRTIDTVARYGGEEFMVILPDTPLEGAMLVAERIRIAFAETPFPLPGTKPVTVTLSLGVTSLASSKSASAAAPELIARADANLYQAKGQGRNQSVGG